MELKKYPDRSTTVDKLQQLHDEVDGNVSVTFRGREIRAESSLNILRIEVLDPAANGVPEDLIAVADMFAGQLRSNDITTRDGDSPERVLDAAKHHIDSNQ